MKPFQTLSQTTRNTLRGGLGLVMASLLWIPFGTGKHGFRELTPFVWMSVLWLVFPVGALLGNWLPDKLQTRSRARGIAFSLTVGLFVGLFLAVAIATLFSLDGWVGLISGGSPGYRASIFNQFRKTYSLAITNIPPFAIVALFLWGIRCKKINLPQAAAEPERVRPSLCHIYILATLSLTSAALFLLFALLLKGKVLMCGLLGLGLPFAGPFLGPIANPGGGSHVGIKLAFVGIAPLILALAPFLFIRRPLSPRVVALAWSAYVTAILFWMSLGLFSLGYSLG